MEIFKSGKTHFSVLCAKTIEKYPVLCSAGMAARRSPAELESEWHWLVCSAHFTPTHQPFLPPWTEVPELSQPSKTATGERSPEGDAPMPRCTSPPVPMRRLMRMEGLDPRRL